MKRATMEGVPILDIDKYLSPLSINGLEGRLLQVPASSKKQRNILLVYGHHASLERMYGLAKALSRYGTVTTPDMPGFGGMDSFYKIGKRPTLDNLADYLATFIKMRFKKNPVTIIAVSLGFSVVTLMLEKYPDMTKHVQLCVSAAGFTHGEDISIPHRKKAIFTAVSKVLSWYVPSLLAKAVMRGPVVRRMHNHSLIRAHSVTETEERRRYRLDFEVWLWQNNDIRTHFFTLHEMLTMNLCTTKVDLPAYHIGVDADQYLDNHLVEQHMRVIYNDFRLLPLPNARVHAPTILASAREAAAFIPPGLRKLLNRKPAE